MVGNSCTEESVDNGLNYGLGYDMSMMRLSVCTSIVITASYASQPVGYSLTTG